MTLREIKEASNEALNERHAALEDERITLGRLDLHGPELMQIENELGQRVMGRLFADHSYENIRAEMYAGFNLYMSSKALQRNRYVIAVPECMPVIQRPNGKVIF
jgi:hypothetical protein